MVNLILYKTTPTLISLKDELLAFASEIDSDGVHLGNIELMKTDVKTYLQIEENQSKGIGLPNGWVPHTRFWYVLDGTRILGSSDLRHALTPNLKDFGGHIGYVIRPSERNKGYATLMLAETMREAKKLGLKELLITAASENTASRKVIEKNGGLLEAERYSQVTGRLTAYYWIKLT